MGVPVLIVQGERDPFGIPPAAPGRTVALVPGDHGLKADLGAVAAAAQAWLRRVLHPVAATTPPAARSLRGARGARRSSRAPIRPFPGAPRRS